MHKGNFGAAAKTKQKNKRNNKNKKKHTVGNQHGEGSPLFTIWPHRKLNIGTYVNNAHFGI